MSDAARALRQTIEAAYDAGGYTLGWRLLYSPAATLEGARVALIGLNPAVGGPMEEHSDFSTPGYSAYVEEDWGPSSTLQGQVVALFKGLNEEPPRVLAGNLVPFRSASWGDLPRRKEALTFGKTIWAAILEKARPELVVTLGIEAGKSVADLLGVRRRQVVSVGWGDVTAWSGEHERVRMVALPHLSRYGIVTRPESRPALRELFGELWKA